MVSTQVAAGSWELGSRAPNIARIITLPPLCARAHTTYIGPKRGPTPTPEMHITLPGPTPSPGHPRKNETCYCYYSVPPGMIKVYIQSAAAAVVAAAALCVTILLLLLLLLAAAVRHRTRPTRGCS